MGKSQEPPGQSAEPTLPKTLSPFILSRWCLRKDTLLVLWPPECVCSQRHQHTHTFVFCFLSPPTQWSSKEVNALHLFHFLHHNVLQRLSLSSLIFKMFFFLLYLCFCACEHARANVWSEAGFGESVLTLDFAEAWFLLFLRLKCVPQASWEILEWVPCLHLPTP